MKMLTMVRASALKCVLYFQSNILTSRPNLLQPLPIVVVQLEAGDRCRNGCIEKRREFLRGTNRLWVGVWRGAVFQVVRDVGVERCEPRSLVRGIYLGEEVVRLGKWDINDWVDLRRSSSFPLLGLLQDLQHICRVRMWLLCLWLWRERRLWCHVGVRRLRTQCWHKGR
jgi:hypothetical protein